MLALILMMKSGKELTMEHIDFNRKKLWELQVLYDEAISKRKEIFYFRNQPLFTNYARNLLEYLNREVGTPQGKTDFRYND
jgi:hypothetical protein